jgi:tetratricopeptide (TPR) repeat protein
MSKKNKEQLSEDVILDVEEVYSKTENFINQHKKLISRVVIGIIAVIALYVSYKNLYLAPLEAEAASQMFMAEKYFQKDSLNLAINGDNNNYGFIKIINDYSGTKAANLAHYYLGICYLRTGQYELAIEELNSFSSNDVMLSTIALGAIGDAYMELGAVEEAVSQYEKAAKNKPNDFTTPYYLFKAGLAYEDLGDYNSALNVYNTIKTEYLTSIEGREIDKYLARAKALAK